MTEPAKRGRGRPRGTTKKAGTPADPTAPKRGKGRPKGSTKKSKSASMDQEAPPAANGTVVKRGRGRPPKHSTKNKTAHAQAGNSSKVDEKKPATSTAKSAAARAEEAPSFVGSYEVTCPSIQEGWDNADNLTLDIASTSTAGVYKASFDFVVLEGVMLLSADEDLLLSYIGELEGNESEQDDGPSDDDEDEDEDEDAEPSAPVGGKRKAASRGPVKSAKKTKVSAPTKFFLEWRGRETGEGEIQTGEHEGWIKFTNAKYDKFSGEMDLAFVGGRAFKGTRVSDVPNLSRESWSDFSESQYEFERVNRWH